MTEEADELLAACRARSPHTQSRLTIVANRLPVVYDAADQSRPSPGGLAEVMRSVNQTHHSSWIGWAGRGENKEKATTNNLKPSQCDDTNWVEIFISQAEEESYYKGFSNGYLWPLFHESIRPPTYDNAQYQCYKGLNQRFAIKAAEISAQNSLVWVHDYHLILVPQFLKCLRPDLRIGFFLHIPFPEAKQLASSPLAGALLEGMLSADLVGFQTPEYSHRFLEAAHKLAGVKIRQQQINPEGANRTTRTSVQTFPVGIDTKKWSQLAERSRAKNDHGRLRQELGSPSVILLGVDRLDYTKGINEKIIAVAQLMLSSRLDPSSTMLVQILQKSRQDSRHYKELEACIDKTTKDMNAQLGFPEQPRIKLLKTTLSSAELAAYYLCADILIVTPRCDGMNIVCKEYVACRPDMQGCLILSKNAGAAQQMGSAWLVDPDNQDAIKNAIMQATKATTAEKIRRMQPLRDNVFRYNAAFWADSFLQKLQQVGCE